MENEKFLVSSMPHIRGGDSIQKIMRDVVISLIPATIGSFIFFGLRALTVIIISILSCVLFEYAFRKYLKKDNTIRDFSAIVTGLLLGLNLPSSVPFWIPILGAFFAIIIVKQLFGGLGQNFMNPALGARAFLLLSFTGEMTTWVKPYDNRFSFVVDATTSPTPLRALEMGAKAGQSDIMKAFIGNVSGSLGETSAVLLLIGGIYLIIRKVISWRIPVSFISSVFLFSILLQLISGENFNYAIQYGIYQVLIGGVMIGAIFMATDYASSPTTPIGQIIMGIGCGFLIVILRKYSVYPEIASFAILFMNLLVPLIEKYTHPRVYGKGKIINE